MVDLSLLLRALRTSYVSGVYNNACPLLASAKHLLTSNTSPTGSLDA